MTLLRVSAAACASMVAAALALTARRVRFQFKDIGLSRIRFITVPVTDSATKSGRVEWTGDADALWDRVRYDKPLGKLRGRLDRGQPGVRRQLTN